MDPQNDRPPSTAAEAPARSLEELLNNRTPSQRELCVWRSIPVKAEPERRFLDTLRSVVQRGALHSFWEWTVLYWCGQSHAVNHAALSLGAVLWIKGETQRGGEIPRETYDFLWERYAKALGLLQQESEPIYPKMICYLVCICIQVFAGKLGMAFGLIHEGVALHARLVTEENIPLNEADFILGFLAGSRILCSQYLSFTTQASPDVGMAPSELSILEPLRTEERVPISPTESITELAQWLTGIAPMFMDEMRGHMATERASRDIVILICAAREPGKVFRYLSLKNKPKDSY